MIRKSGYRFSEKIMLHQNVRASIDSTRNDCALVDLEQTGGAHAAADAHGDDRAVGAARVPFDQDVAGHARAAHAVGMADRDRAAVDVEPFLRNPETVAAVEHLARKRLVELPKIDVLALEALTAEKLGNGEYRPDAHLVRLAAGDGEAAERAERLVGAARAPHW